MLTSLAVTVLLLLDYVDAVLESTPLRTDPATIATPNLKKHHDAVQAVMEQHLYALDIVLKTY